MKKTDSKPTLAEEAAQAAKAAAAAAEEMAKVSQQLLTSKSEGQFGKSIKYHWSFFYPFHYG